jgi:hypothetical protein
MTDQNPLIVITNVLRQLPGLCNAAGKEEPPIIESIRTTCQNAPDYVKTAIPITTTPPFSHKSKWVLKTRAKA